MEELRSKVDGSVICRYVRKDQVSGYRFDMSDREELIQASARKFSAGTKVPAHKHKQQERVTHGTQEAWVVIEGKVIAFVYDINDSLIDGVELYGGDMIVFFRGGHALTVVEEGTIFYEFKNGPYYGYELDKETI